MTSIAGRMPFFRGLQAAGGIAPYLINGWLPDTDLDFIRGYGKADKFYNIDTDWAALNTALSAAYGGPGTVGMRYNEAGLLVPGVAGKPRIDHEPSTLAKLGARFEGARTNMILRPAAIGGTNWSLVSGAIADLDADVAPDGQQTLSEITAVGPNTSSRVQTGSMAAVASTVYSISCFLKQGSSSSTTMRIFNGAVSTQIASSGVAWSAGVPSLQSSSGALDRFLREIRNGIYRHGYRISSGIHTSLAFLLYPDPGTGALSTKGWGAQLEQANFPSTPIPYGAGVAVTRDADTYSMPISGSEGRGYFAARTAPGVQDEQVLWEAVGNGGNDRIRLYRDASQHIKLDVKIGGSDVVSLDGGVIADSTDFKAAISWEAGAYRLAVNGVLATPSTHASAPVISTQYLGNSAAGDRGWFGCIRRRAHGAQKATAQWLQDVTA